MCIYVCIRWLCLEFWPQFGVFIFWAAPRIIQNLVFLIQEGAWDVQNPKYSGLDKAFGNESKLAEIEQRHVKQVNTTRFVHQRFQSGRNSTLEGGPPPHQIPMVDLIPCSDGRSPPEACKNQVFIRFVR